MFIHAHTEPDKLRYIWYRHHYNDDDDDDDDDVFTTIDVTGEGNEELITSCQTLWSFYSMLVSAIISHNLSDKHGIPNLTNCQKLTEVDLNEQDRPVSAMKSLSA